MTLPEFTGYSDYSIFITDDKGRTGNIRGSYKESAERLLITMWNPTKEDINKYKPAGTSSDYAWTSTPYSTNGYHYYYRMSDGKVSDYSYDRDMIGRRSVKKNCFQRCIRR